MAATASAERRNLFELIAVRSFRRGVFTLVSGRQSEMYFNLKPTMLDPKGALLCAAAFLEILAEEQARTAGGLEMGAVPMLGSIAALSSMRGSPVRTFFVRKAAKEHGTKELIEGLAPGETLQGARAVIVDDVATTGQSILQAAVAAREAGANVDCALVLVDREECASEKLARESIRLRSIFRGGEFLRRGISAAGLAQP